MGNAKNIFDRIGDAKELGDFAPRLSLGRHTLALKNFRLKETEKRKDQLLEVEFMVVATNAADSQVGETRSWMFYLSGEWAEYGERRAKAFIAALAKGIGDTETPPGVFGAELNDESQPGRGIQIDADIWLVRNKDGSAKTAKNSGEEIHNATFKEVAQSGEDVAAMRQRVEENTEPTPVKVAAKAAVAEPIAPPPVAKASGSGIGLLKGLRK